MVVVIFRNIFRNTKLGLKDYCTNSSLAGLSYIVNDKLHYTERIFWFICFGISCFCSYYLINSYNKSFNENAISLVIETVQPFETLTFPSVSVCELGFSKQGKIDIERLVIEECSANGTLEDAAVDLFMHGIIYPTSGPIYLEKCKNAEANPKVMQCPKSGFRRFAEIIRLPCKELILHCKWQEKPFDCCRYFLPLSTNIGKCFLLNSIQTTQKNGKNWLNVDIRNDNKSNEMTMVFRRPVSVTVGNEDDVPQMLLLRLAQSSEANTYHIFYAFNLIDMVNDDEIQKINYISRKCKFPEETSSDSLYKYHSFSACTSSCIRNEQLRKCNCTYYTYSTKKAHEVNECDLNGIKCLLGKGILFPNKKSLQPWRPNGLPCTCLPSCNEKQIKITTIRSEIATGINNKSMTLKLQSFPTEKYRRQTVRGKLEIVVTIGGILGLFLGASILSGIEFLYFLIVRILKIF